MESSRQIEDLAADWLARRDAGTWSAQDQQELDQWLAQSFKNRVAYLRLEAVWEKATRLKAFGVGTERGNVPPPGEWRSSPFFSASSEKPEEGGTGATTADTTITAIAPVIPARSNLGGSSRVRGTHRTFFFATAATALIAAGTAFHFYSGGLARHHYATPVGGTASIPLSDGTKVTLNTASEIRIKLTPNARRVELKKGEAFFEVAKDPARPFIVEAGGKRIIAVGTRFSVRHEKAEDVRVTVTEGAVRLENGDAGDSGSNEPSETASTHRAQTSQNTSAGGVTQSVLLAAGNIARASSGSILVQKETAQEAENSLSWRTGYLIFDEIALADAVAEFNRYTHQQIRIEDPRIAAIRISGKFRSDSSDIFLRLLRDGYAINAHPAGDTIVLTSTSR